MAVAAAAVGLTIASTGCGASHPRAVAQSAGCDRSSLSLAIGYWTHIVAQDIRTTAAAKTDGDPGLRGYGRSLRTDSGHGETAIRAAQACTATGRGRREQWARDMRLWRRVGGLVASGAPDSQVAAAIATANAAKPAE